MALSKITNLSILDDTIVNADINNVSAAKVTAGTLATARLGTGTASSSTVLYGDQTYKAEPGGGKILQTMNQTFTGTATSVTTNSLTATEITSQITPSATSSLIYVTINASLAMSEGSGSGCKFQAGIYRSIGGASYTLVYAGQDNSYGGIGQNDTWTSISIAVPTTLTFMDAPNTTSAVDYKLYIGLNVASGVGDSVNTGASNMERGIILMEVAA